MLGRPLAVALALLGAMLAGCANPSDDGDGAGEGIFMTASRSGTSSAPGGFAPVKTKATEGGVTGLVVDEGIRPLANVTVRLLQPGLEALTDPDGLFAFAGLAPGAYTLSATAPGFLAIAQTVTVDADAATKVKIVLLAAAAGTQPYHTTYLFRGFIEASAGIAGFALETALEPYTNDTLCSCTFFFAVAEHPVDFILEAQWTDTVPADPSGLGLYWDFATAAGTNLTNGFSLNPLWHLVLAKDYPSDNLDYRVRLMGGWTWVAAQQRYDLYVTVFYKEHAPDGWSLVKGDT